MAKPWIMYHGSQEHSLHLSSETSTGICIPSMQHGTLPVQKALSSSIKYRDRQLASSLTTIQREILVVLPEWLVILDGRH